MDTNLSDTDFLAQCNYMLVCIEIYMPCYSTLINERCLNVLYKYILLI